MDEQDEGAKVGLWVVLGIITLLLFGLIGGLVIRTMNAKQPPSRRRWRPRRPRRPPPRPWPRPTCWSTCRCPAWSGARVLRPRQVRAAGRRRRALAPAVKALADAPGKTLVIAGFHDPSGDPAHNAELAKQRAKAVRAALTAQGCDPARVQLRKPEQTALGGPPEEARRVEVRLVD